MQILSHTNAHVTAPTSGWWAGLMWLRMATCCHLLWRR